MKAGVLLVTLPPSDSQVLNKDIGFWGHVYPPESPSEMIVSGVGTWLRDRTTFYTSMRPKSEFQHPHINLGITCMSRTLVLCREERQESQGLLTTSLAPDAVRDPVSGRMWRRMGKDTW